MNECERAMTFFLKVTTVALTLVRPRLLKCDTVQDIVILKIYVKLNRNLFNTEEASVMKMFFYLKITTVTLTFNIECSKSNFAIHIIYVKLN